MIRIVMITVGDRKDSDEELSYAKSVYQITPMQ